MKNVPRNASPRLVFCLLSSPCTFKYLLIPLLSSNYLLFLSHIQYFPPSSLYPSIPRPLPKMLNYLLPVTLLLTFAAATTPIAPVPPVLPTSGSGACNNLAVLNSCLATTQASTLLCATTDYACLCGRFTDVVGYVLPSLLLCSERLTRDVIVVSQAQDVQMMRDGRECIRINSLIVYPLSSSI